MEWIEPPPAPDSPAFPDLHPLVSRALAQRGFHTPEAVKAFLDPHFYSPTPPAEIPGLAEAVDRIALAIRGKKPICVWGDFDVDGQTSTTILVEALQELGAKVTYHIPVRDQEGHGVNLPLLARMIDQGVKLILTCDTGISANEAVEYAHSRSVEMVITDHHDLPEHIPTAEVVTNPKFLPEEHPLSTLSGAGLAFKLAEEFFRRFGREGAAEPLVDLAGLGLVADVAQLTGDARYLVQCGIESLRHSSRLGMQALFDFAKLLPGHLTEEHISYEIAPRLNALGRLADANPAVEFFTTTDPVRARVLANILEGLNIQRQLLCSQVTRAAEAQLRDQPNLLEEPILVLAGPGWPAGVVGIVASRLVDRYNKPAILFSISPEGLARGSARSVEGLNITAAIAQQADLLRNYGGHPMAAGLTLEAKKLPEFRIRLARSVDKMTGKAAISDTLLIDACLNLPELSLELAEALESLAPYGPGNERLLLSTRDLILKSSTKIGRNQEHLKLMVADADENMQSVLWWNGADETLPEGRFDLAYTLRTSDWRGTPQLQLEMVDFRLKEPAKIQVKSPGIQVMDCRNVLNPTRMLEDLCSKDSTIVWVEGPQKRALGGLDRNELVPADHLVVWTAPASPEEFRQALEKVHPKTVILFAATEANQPVEKFLEKLAGLLKYCLQQKGGRTTWRELAAAAAEQEITVRCGVEWLAATGRICFTVSGENELVLSSGDSMKDPQKAARLWEDLQTLLAESAAYRAFFRQVEQEGLLPKR